MRMYPVVILAGGLASRLRPLTETIPKSLIDIDGQPFVAHQLRLLQKNNISHVVICIGYLGEKICEFVGDGSQFGLHVSYVQDGPRLLGTGGAIKNALPLLENEKAFFILYGDSYLPCDFAAVQQAFINSQRKALMTLFRNNNMWGISNIEYADGEILQYDKVYHNEKMHYIDYGLSIMTPAVMKSMPENNETFDLAFVYQNLLQQDLLAAYEITERFYEAGSFKGIQELNYFLQGQAE